MADISWIAGARVVLLGKQAGAAEVKERITSHNRSETYNQQAQGSHLIALINHGKDQYTWAIECNLTLARTPAQEAFDLQEFAKGKPQSAFPGSLTPVINVIDS
ncbi:hypothetical protein HKW97_24375 (plasmid) [Pseudomonas luteola]|uniref:hypothetical protein n=1 Tax=Pseudomonas luteola TaxID=47886 RepID=UPI00388F8BBF